jgi:hypothetical protein
MSEIDNRSYRAPIFRVMQKKNRPDVGRRFRVFRFAASISAARLAFATTTLGPAGRGGADLGPTVLRFARSSARRSRIMRRRR